MPIPTQALIESSQPLDKRILRFLSENPTQAFTELEVMAGVEGQEARSLEIAMIFWDKARRLKVITPFRNSLKALANSGSVLTGTRGGIKYWAIDQKHIQK